MDHLDTHVQYEIDMVRHLFTRMTTHNTTHVDQITVNAYVEAFWLHVSCLAKHVGMWNLEDDPLWRKIEDQIFTLGEQRSHTLADKLNDADIVTAIRYLTEAGIAL